MKTKLQKLIDEIRDAQSELTDEERKSLWLDIQDGYCKECGREETGTRCQCWNDE